MSKEISYVEKYKREHPVRFWWAGIRLDIELFWYWICNNPVWNFSSEDGPFLEYARTKERLPENDPRYFED